ncbi:MAG: efflux RND transporter periplasmic adaptor subunit [Chlorobi bacterium]|nr:efflux RND transporter periplasmic adaptor subunit [Chlorobiota bacterium]
MKYFFSMTLAVFAVSAFWFVLQGCGKTGAGETETELVEKKHKAEVVLSPDVVKGIGLRTGTPTRTILRQKFIAQGKVVVNPDYVAHLNSLVTGRVRKIYVQIGDYVKKGAPLFELESLEIANITADYIRAKAEYNAQKANYERIKTLREEDIKSEKDLIAAKAKYERAEAELKAAADRKLHSLGFSDEDVENMFGSKEHRRGILLVKSPISGYVTERNIELGQLIQPDTDIMKVIDNTRIWVEAGVYEKDYSHLKIGQTVIITATALPGKKYRGKVVKVNKELQAESRTFKVFIKINEGKAELIPNMFTTVVFEYTTPDSVMVLPEEAVQFDGADYFVFITEDGNTFRRREVTIGQKMDSLVVIKDGLENTDRVVLSKAFLVKSEMEKESFGEGHGD